MKNFVFLILIFFGINTSALAQQDGPLAAMNSLNEGAEWDGVGRLHIGKTGFCTAALISDKLVLTAAHCLFNKADGSRISERDLQFQAGVRLGRAAAYRGVRRSIVFEDYQFGGAGDPARVASDLALIELDQPIRTNTVTPFTQTAKVQPGEAVQIVSYAVQRERAPSLQKLCHVLGAMDAALVLSCNVDFGASGAPIFAVRNGVKAIVAVVSARASMNGETVSLVAPVADKLVQMQAEMAASDGVFHRKKPKVFRLTRDQAAAQTGAKFLRP